MLRLFLAEKIAQIRGKKIPTNSSTAAKKSKNLVNRRKSERVSLDHKHMTMMNEQDIFLIKDISQTGFSSQVSPRTFSRLNVSDTYKARIRYFGEVYDLHARVSWKSDSKSVVGFELVNPNPDTLALIRRLIQPISIAESMQKMESTPFKHEHFKKTWYHGDSDTDLYIWRDEQQRVTAWQFVNRDIFVEWDFSQGVRTGHLSIDQNSKTSVLDVTSAALRQNFDQKPRSDRLQFATDVLMAIPDLESRDELLNVLMEG